MAGRNQHYIPKSLLRGFKAEGRKSKKVTYVWVYRVGVDPCCPATEGVGAQRHFYSELSKDGSRTLDDAITDYEGGFNEVLYRLREASPDHPVDASEAAEFVSHLMLRNAHFRHALHHGFRGIVDIAIKAISDREAARRLFGLHGHGPCGLFREKFSDLYAEHPDQFPTNLPYGLVEYMAFLVAKEGYDEAFDQTVAFLSPAVSEMVESLAGEVKSGHNRVLADLFFPTGIIDKIGLSDWWVVEAAAPIILADCVALALCQNGSYQPLLFTNPSDVRMAYLPLSANKCLVGTRGEQAALNVDEFNRGAAGCSRSYFISSVFDDVRAALVQEIGKTSNVSIDGALIQAELRLFELDPEKDHDAPAFSLGVTDAHIADQQLNYQISFSVGFDADQAELAGNAIQALVNEASAVWPLSRLDGLTFADDYEGALATLDRGADWPPLSSTDTELGLGVCMAPQVLRGGIVKSRIICRGFLATNLLSDDREAKAFAERCILQGLVEVGYDDHLMATLPGFHTGRFDDDFLSFKMGCVLPGLSRYCVHRSIADEARESASTSAALLANCLEVAERKMKGALMSFQQSKDYGQAFTAACENTRNILMFSAQLAGDLKAQQLTINDLEEPLNVLHQKGLYRWFELFSADLDAWWNALWSDPKIDDFTIFIAHADRLISNLGVLTWKGDEGWLIYPLEIAAPTG